MFTGIFTLRHKFPRRRPLISFIMQIYLLARLEAAQLKKVFVLKDNNRTWSTCECTALINGTEWKNSLAETSVIEEVNEKKIKLIQLDAIKVNINYHKTTWINENRHHNWRFVSSSKISCLPYVISIIQVIEWRLIWQKIFEWSN